MSKIDHAADKVKQTTDKAADAAKSAATKTGEKLKDVGSAIKKEST